MIQTKDNPTLAEAIKAVAQGYARSPRGRGVKPARSGSPKGHGVKPARSGRKGVVIYVDADMATAIRQMAVSLDTTVQVIGERAFREVLSSVAVEVGPPLSAEQPRIVRAPGSRLDAFASFFFPKRVYMNVLKPCLADTQEEYFEALSEGKTRKSQWVRIRGVAGFWWTVALQMPVSLSKMVKKLWTIAGG